MKKLVMTSKSDMFEGWYETVKDYTPESVILPITKEEEIVLRAISYDRFIQRGYYPDSMPLRPNKFSKEEENKIIIGLKNKIDQILKGNKRFFRANVFSPKDTGKCIVSNADEVIEAFSLSERIFYKAGMLMEGKPMTFVFRDIINIKEEYRVFVKDNKIIGISQYEDSDVIVKNEPVENVYSINEGDILKIYTWVEDMIKITGVDTAVVDVAKLLNGSYCVIELNPFNGVTDKCLLAEYKMYDEPYKNLIVAYATSINSIRIIELKIDNNKVNMIHEEILEIKEDERKDISSLLSSLKLKMLDKK